MKHFLKFFIGALITLPIIGQELPDGKNPFIVDVLDLDHEDDTAGPSRPVAPPRRDRIVPKVPVRADLNPAPTRQQSPSSSPPRSPRDTTPTFSEYVDTSAVRDTIKQQSSPSSPPASPIAKPLFAGYEDASTIPAMPAITAAPAQSSTRATQSNRSRHVHGSGAWPQRPAGSKRPGNPDHQSMRRGGGQNPSTIDELLQKVDQFPQSVSVYFVNDSDKKFAVKIFVQEDDKLYPIIQRTTEAKRMRNETKLEKVPYDGNEMLISLSRVEIPPKSIFALDVNKQKPIIIFIELPDGKSLNGKSLMGGKKIALHSFSNRATLFAVGITDSDRLTYDGQSKPIRSSTELSVAKWLANKIKKSDYTVYHFGTNSTGGGAVAGAYAKRSNYNGVPILKSYDQ